MTCTTSTRRAGRPGGFDSVRKIKVLLQVADKDFDEEDIAPPGGSVKSRG